MARYVNQITGVALAALALLVGCGKAIPFLGGAGGSQKAVDGATTTLGTIYPVTFVVSAIDMNWSAADLPFNGPGGAVQIGSPISNGQTEFQFVYTYPSNNFQLSGAHMLIDSSRDSSDTEGIFVDGVFSGAPPPSYVNATSPKTLFDVTSTANPASIRNPFYNSWAIAHYKTGIRNTFDLDVKTLLQDGTGAQLIDPYTALADGVLPVVTGDDSQVYQAFLFVNGYTISKSDTGLSCSNSAPNTFENLYLHNDGYSTTPLTVFTGTVKTPNTSCAWSTVPNPDNCTAAYSVPFQSVDFNYDAPLPNVGLTNITLTEAKLNLGLTRQATGKSAIVVNGIGIGETGFLTDPNTPASTALVESWLTDAPTVTKWQNFLATITTDGAPNTPVSIDLLDLYGAAQMRSLLAQGKLNITIAGSIAEVHAQANPTSSRGAGFPVWGPEFSLKGTYFNDICVIPDDPSSPLSGSLPPYPPVTPDGVPPVLASIQATEVTATTAKLIWLTDEYGDSQADYATSINADTTLISPITKTDATDNIFHEIDLTGLTPYTIYDFRVRSQDYWGNTRESNTFNFKTKR